MPTKTVKAIILSRKNWGEADRLVSAFSANEGKIKILAKGSRKAKSKMAGHIEPFSIGEYFLAEGKAHYVLAGAQAIQPNQKISENLESFRDASYVCEIINTISADGQPNIKNYNLLKATLTTLSDASDTQREIILRYFEFSILKNSGFAPNFENCKKCGQKLIETEKYIGTFEGVFCANCSTDGIKIKKNVLKILRLFDSREINEIVKIKDVQNFNQELKDVIWPFLYDIMPKTPKSLGISGDDCKPNGADEK